MKNLRKLILDAEPNKYTDEQKIDLISKYYDVIGKDKYIVICMEEISEVVQVLSNPFLFGKDLLSLIEEVVDLKICIYDLKFIYRQYKEDIDKIPKLSESYKKHLNKVRVGEYYSLKCIKNLCFMQQELSKIIRKKEGYESKDKILSIIETLENIADEIIIVYALDSDTMDRIETIKFQRQEERIATDTCH